jgi:hypothetical protein
VHERLRASVDRDVAVLASLVLFAGTSLFWSMTRASGLADVLAFTSVALVLMALPRVARGSYGSALAWAIIAAIPQVIRWGLDASNDSRAVTASAILFSSTAGFLSLTPAAYVALAGTCASLRTSRVDAVYGLVCVLLWIGAGVVLPAVGVDGRFAHGLTAALAVLAPGLAFGIDYARRRPWLAAALLVTAVVTWNYWLMVQFTVGTLPKDAPVSFGALVRQQFDVHTRAPYVYPFAFPANVWFAWREGVPADRYETLAFEPRRESLDLTLDASTARFVLDGWEAVSPSPNESHIWTRESRATIAVPLALPPARDVDVAVTARARLEEPPVKATMAVEINGREIGRFVVPSDAPAETVLRVPADVGAIWRAGYNRVTLVSYGVTRVDPSDARPPGPLARRLGSRAWPVAIYRLRIAAGQTP